MLDGERRLRRSDGTELWVVQSHEVVRRNDGEPQFVVLSMVDVTDRRRAEDDLVRRAFVDPLTGLPNRRALTDRLRHAVALSRRRGLQVGLVHLNIDRFPGGQQSLGHEAGDLLLSQIADRLRWSTRVEDTAVRLGADEFLVVAEDVEDLDGLRALADRLLSVLDEPFLVHEREINLSASVGLTLGADLSPDDLLRQAQSALTKAKVDGSRGRIEVYEGALRHGDVDALQLETELRHAIDSEELRLFYQPIVDLCDEPLLGYEALIRWQHPTRGLLPPAAFLSAAENNRLTSRLGRVGAVAGVSRRGRLGRGAAGAREHLGPAPGRGRVQRAGRRRARGVRARPARLELEIAESTALFAAEATLRSVSVVTDGGVTLALDDFGTGYSAITALHRLPIHTLKIDRSFVADVVAEPATAALVQGLLQLGGHGPAGHRRGHRGRSRPAGCSARLRHGAGLRLRAAGPAARPGREKAPPDLATLGDAAELADWVTGLVPDAVPMSRLSPSIEELVAAEELAAEEPDDGPPSPDFHATGQWDTPGTDRPS